MTPNAQRLVDLFGWYGMLAVLGAYALVSFNLYVPGQLLILFLNLTGSIGLGVEALSKRDKPVVILNAVWAIVAIIGLLR